MLRLAVLLTLLGACTLVRSEPPTARYAAAQLELAQTELDGARAALLMHDYALARQLAAQAHLDARLAWRMTESPFLRRAALDALQSADRLRTQGVLPARAGGRP